MENNACIVLLHHRNNANLFRRSKCAGFCSIQQLKFSTSGKNPYKKSYTKWYCFSILKKRVYIWKENVHVKHVLYTLYQNDTFLYICTNMIQVFYMKFWGECCLKLESPVQEGRNTDYEQSCIVRGMQRLQLYNYTIIADNYTKLDPKDSLLGNTH